ncbi:MAG: amidohydrolase [Bacteroidetes bacterium]|nr:amidohydrolase [Bacteroidota bacterium]HCI72609.1 amidohydrolase [Balneola sp.]|tara:strand:+ start:10409 stop:11545 length:1137 start_codon:yes stop_codon:yes gene_type:complete
MLSQLTSLRKELHRFPELSGKEFETAQRIVNFLTPFEPTKIISELGTTGVAAVYDYGDPETTILIRCELDALPIQEVNTFEYRSVTDSVSHKCGHDGHMVIVAGLAEWLQEAPLENARIVLLFQPAEETGEGAPGILADENFEQIIPDYIFALHNLPGFPMHQIVTTGSEFTSTVQSVSISLHGKESHAAEPENGLNPALALAELINSYNDIVVNDINSEDFALITPVYSSMGSKDYGVSPADGELHLTIRTWTPDEMNALMKKIETIAQDVALKHSLKHEMLWFDYFSATNNDPFCNTIIKESAKERGFQLNQREHPFKFGEDFGVFTQRYSGAMFGLGSGEETPALHNPDYDFPDEIIETGIAMFREIILKTLENR